jgi:1-pyrroline-4-hydroxy-2-carboxylate deaminase
VTGRTGPRSWAGVLVALTTPFDADEAVDLDAFRAHVRWLRDRGLDGFVAAGSLGEGASLTAEERMLLLRELAATVGPGDRVIAAVAAARTSEAVDQARRAADAGATGLLVLPPYVYRPDDREVVAHFGRVFRATDLPCMLYNNPPAYGTDVRPDQVLALAEAHPTLTGVKESSGDVRRISALRAELGDRVEVAVGVDDAVVEGVAAGAVGWVAGLANAFPRASVELFDRARRGDAGPAAELYRWFLPLLRMDATPKFVQQIKLIQAERGHGSPRVRPPRLELEGEERSGVLAALRAAMAHPPAGVSLE